jgi:Tol biopolymer transport system component
VHGSTGNNKPDQIFIMHPDGTGFRQLTFSNRYKVFKFWAGDSNSITYSELVENGSEEIKHEYYEVDIRTGARKRYTGDIFRTDFHDWAYSPQGNLVAYIEKGSIGNQYYLWIMDREGSNPRQLIDTPVEHFRWSWSPDGTQLVVGLPTGIEDGVYTCTDFYLVSVDGSSLEQLTDSGDRSEHDISWSPGGEWIAFTQSDFCLGGGVIGQQLYLIRTDGSGLTKLPNVPRRSALSPDWSPLPGLELGKTFTVTESGAGLRLRSEPTTKSKELIKLSGGDQILILDGPVEADEYLWWRIRVENSGLEGWVVEIPGWFTGE